MSTPRPQPDLVDSVGSVAERVRKLEVGIGVRGPGYEIQVYDFDPPATFDGAGNLTNIQGHIAVARYGGSIHMWSIGGDLKIPAGYNGLHVLDLPQGWAPEDPVDSFIETTEGERIPVTVSIGGSVDLAVSLT
jgi:hypothetical protein